jgi:TonB family protein
MTDGALMKSRIFATVWMVLAFVAPASAQQDSPLTAARDLYASARYDEALAVLNGMQPGDGLVPDRKSIEQYRSLCLLALGRGTEAESAIAAVVTADPLFQPGEADASPRVRAAFSDVRQRLLPQIANSRYAAAKDAFDHKEFGAAEQQFKDLLSLIDDPQMGGRLKDLRVLVAGFLDLSSAAATPPPAPQPKADEAPKPAPAPAVPASHIWGPGEPGVTPPTAVRQEVPRVQTTIASQTRDRGMLEIVIDEQGRVVGITVRNSIHVMYDPLLVAAARDWKYKPATVNGVPVKFRKLVQIVVDKR